MCNLFSVMFCFVFLTWGSHEQAEVVVKDALWAQVDGGKRVLWYAAGTLCWMLIIGRYTQGELLQSSYLDD